MNKFGVSLHPGGEGLTFSLPPRTAELLTMEEAIELAICILLRAGINGPTDKRLAGAFAEAFRAPAGDDDNESTMTERVNDDTPPARRGAGGAALPTPGDPRRDRRGAGRGREGRRPGR